MPQLSDKTREPWLTIVDHPLVRHKLSLMRKHDTSTSKFRALMREISLLLAYEATRDLALEEILIETPLEPATVPDRKSTRLNSSHGYISYAVFCLKKKNNT